MFEVVGARSKRKSFLWIISVVSHLAFGLAVFSWPLLHAADEEVGEPKLQWFPVTMIGNGGGSPAAAEREEKSNAVDPKRRAQLHPPPGHLVQPDQSAVPPVTEPALAAEKASSTASENTGPITEIGGKGNGKGRGPQDGQGEGDDPTAGIGELIGADSNIVFDADVNREVQLPVIVHRVEPNYPNPLLMAHIEGAAEISALIEADGHVSSIGIASATHPLFGKSAAEAVSQWIYHPARHGGLPVRVRILIHVTFRLK